VSVSPATVDREGQRIQILAELRDVPLQRRPETSAQPAAMI
jgi:hypothetical protein